MTNSTLFKIIGSIAILAAAASIAGLGTFATFTSSTSASTSISSGTVSIALGATGSVTNRLTVNATNIVPGDTIQRSVDLTSSSSDPLGSLSLTTSALPTSLLDTDPTNGLQMTITKCSAPWTESGTSPAFTYSCSGTTGSVLASRPVIGSNMSLTGLNVLSSASATDHLLVTLSLPASADNTFQGKSSTVTYAFTGTQRAATNK